MKATITESSYDLSFEYDSVINNIICIQDNDAYSPTLKRVVEIKTGDKFKAVRINRRYSFILNDDLIEAHIEYYEILDTWRNEKINSILD